jgi:hypothetical protein
MGCNCKNDTITSIDGVEVKNDGPSMFIKILKAIIFTIVLTILSPVILIIVWIYGISSAFNGDIDMVSKIIKVYKSKQNKIEEEENIDLDDYNSDNYELVDVEEINV